MAKTRKSVFFCQECGYESAKWQGQCPACKAWNTFVEEPQITVKGVKSTCSGKELRPVTLKEVSMAEEKRISSGMQELDRVLGLSLIHI